LPGQEPGLPHDALVSWHAISNQVWLWNMVLTWALVPLIWVLFLLYGELVGDRRWGYLLQYLSIPVGIGVAQALLFWRGNTAALGGRAIALHLLIFSDCLMIWLFTLFIGAAGGIHFLFPATLALPFYFFRRGVHRGAWVTKGAWVGLILGQFAVALFMVTGGWIGLPAIVTVIARRVMLALAGIIAIVWVVYFWWQLEAGPRFLRFWEKISTLGVPEFIQGTERKKQILLNRAFFLVGIYCFVLVPFLSAAGAVIGKLYGHQNMLRKFSPFVASIAPFLPFSAFIILIRMKYPRLLLQGGPFYHWAAPMVTTIISIQVFLLDIQVQPKVNFSIFFVAVMAGLIAFIPSLKNRLALGVGLSIIVVMNSVRIYFHEN
jgi:hypothetical protein